MRRNAYILVVVLGICGSAEARQLPDRPKVEVAGSVGVISARPGENHTMYDDDWYGQGRYAGSVAYYWTRHLKTEFEHQWSGEGTRYVDDYTLVAGVPLHFAAESSHQLQQSSLRMVWQFRDNAWVHPYVSAGAVLDAERQRSHTPVTYQPDARGQRVLVQNERNFDERTELRGGVSLGAGAKFYMTRRAFFNAGGVVTYSQPDKGTVNLVAGFGIDF